MELYSVYDDLFGAYGKVITGMEDVIEQVLPVLKNTPVPDSVQYVPEYEPLQRLNAADEFRTHLYGGMPVQLGWCNGHNTKLNCLEYHRNSEFNLGTEDFILLVAGLNEISGGMLNTDSVKAFRVPAGVLVECYATTLHYAPCHCDAKTGFQVMVVLPKGTNTQKPDVQAKMPEDAYLWACNKWLLAHPESQEAAEGACIGLKGANIDIKNFI